MGRVAGWFGVLALTVLAATAAPLPDRPVRDFALRDGYGQVHRLDDFRDRKAVVVIFLGTECPLCQLYAPRLAALAAEFTPRGVGFLGVVSNEQDTLAEIKAYTVKRQLPFPLLKDPGAKVADALGAERTPEVFVLDAARRVRYRGRIDDQFSVGAHRGKATKEELRSALTAILEGRAVEPAATRASGCLIGRPPRATSSPATSASAPKGNESVTEPTFWRDVAPILQKRCQQCHRQGQLAPFPLLEYDDAAGWAPMMGEVVREGRMPPWGADPRYGHFANESRLSEDERKTLLAWIDSHRPEGRRQDAPPPRTFVDGWQIPEPDFVVSMSDAPYQVPAEGLIDYQYFTVDPGFTEDKWVAAVQCRAGDPTVVHHMAVFIWMPGEDWIDSFKHFLSGNAQGWGRMIFPAGTALHLPAGSKFVFVMHYAPSGVPREDNSEMGLVFADPKTVRRRCWTVVAANDKLEIPPGDPNYPATASLTFDADTYLVSLFPHMHARGKSFRYDATYPDGKKETLLNVPRFDFGWQENYELAEPMLLPKGTKVDCLAVYDNSEANPLNPDPSARVTWGFQSDDEMLDGHMQVARDIGASSFGSRELIKLAASVVAILAVVAGLTFMLKRFLGRRATEAVPDRAAVMPLPGDGARFAVAVASLLAAPVAVLIDTRLAMSRGWIADSPALAKAAPLLAASALTALAVALAAPAVRRALARQWAQVAAMCSSAIVAWMVFDAAAGSFLPVASFHGRAPNVEYHFQPTSERFFGVTSPAMARYDHRGFRRASGGSAPSAYKVLCVGGSATECLYLDESRAWPALLRGSLESRLGRPVEIVAAATSEAASGHHERLLRDQRLLADFDAVVLFVGVGDLMRELKGFDAGVAPPFWYRSTSVEFIRRFWNNRLGHALIPYDSTGERYLHARRFQPFSRPAQSLPVEAYAREYGERIGRLVSLASQGGRTVIVAPTPALWSPVLTTSAKRRLAIARVFPAGREWDLMTPERMASLLKGMANAARESAQVAGATVIDTDRMNGDERIYFDDYHLNEAGCAELARRVTESWPRKPKGD